MTLTDTPSTAAAAATDQTGLFVVSYRIGGDKPGATTFDVHLAVDTPHETVSGAGRISNGSIHPALDVATTLEGDFTTMTVMPDRSSILVTLTGRPVISFPVGGGIGPVILPNADLRLVLDERWDTGTANYRYTADGTTWKSVTGAPVRRVDSPSADQVVGALPTVVLSPEDVTATWADGWLVLHAEGHEDGVAGIRIVEQARELLPPAYEVVGRRSPAIGMFPYAVTGTFALGTKPEFVEFVSPTGARQVPVG